jgi:hypothetical protein
MIWWFFSQLSFGPFAGATNLSELNTFLAQSELQKCLGDPSCKAVPGVLLSSALSEELMESDALCDTPNPPLQCSCEKKKNRKMKRPSSPAPPGLLLVAQITPTQNECIVGTKSEFDANTVKNFVEHGMGIKSGETFSEQDFSNLESRLPQLASDFKPDINARNSLLFYGLSQIVAHKKLGEEEAIEYINNKISAIDGNNEQDRLKTLAAFSAFLYRGYNIARNPFQDPNPTDTRALTFNDLLQAGLNNTPGGPGDRSMGGVCNDISAAVAKLGNKLFPDDDVLVMSSGTHFGIALKKPNQKPMIINWGYQTTGFSDLTLSPKIPVENTRIYQFRKGKMSQIAETETEMGSVFKALIPGLTPALSTTATPSVMTTDLINRRAHRDQKQIDFNAKAGTAGGTHSHLLVLVAQRTTTTPGLQRSTSLTVAPQRLKDGANSSLNFNLRGHIQKNQILFQSPRLEILGSTGIELSLQGAKRLTQDNDPVHGIEAAAGGLRTHQTLRFESWPQGETTPRVSGQIQAVQALGSSDESLRQSAISDSSILKATLNSMTFTRLHLNQINANAEIEIPLNPSLQSKSQIRYQGSNIGQTLGVTSGLGIRTPSNTEVYAFVGYVENGMKGFQTRSSFLMQPSGGVLGGGVRTKRGVEVSGQIQGLGAKGVPTQGNFKLALPILKNAIPQKKEGLGNPR